MRNVNNLIPIAAFQTWENGGTQISSLVIGEEEVSRFIEDSKDSFARLHVFTDLEEAEKAYDMYYETVYGLPCHFCGNNTEVYDFSYIVEVKDSIYGTTTDAHICEYCYCANVEKDIFNH